MFKCADYFSHTPLTSPTHPDEKRCLCAENSSLSLQTATIGTNIVSAVVAVIVLHLALGLFIYKVYTEQIFETLFGANFEEFCCRHTLMMAKRASSLIEEDISLVNYGLVKPLYLP